jgi:hypothetical protein
MPLADTVTMSPLAPEPKIFPGFVSGGRIRSTAIGSTRSVASFARSRARPPSRISASVSA